MENNKEKHVGISEAFVYAFALSQILFVYLPCCYFKQENEKTLVRKTISESTTKTMRIALESVVARGGGKVTYIDGYRVGGKTGTAQKVENGRYLENNYSFLSNSK